MENFKKLSVSNLEKLKKLSDTIIAEEMSKHEIAEELSRIYSFFSTTGTDKVKQELTALIDKLKKNG